MPEAAEPVSPGVGRGHAERAGPALVSSDAGRIGPATGGDRADGLALSDADLTAARPVGSSS